jgi:carbon storage regulator
MLVLSRKPGESLTIGENVTIKVVRTQGGRVQLAIDAPREVAIRRSELAKHDPKQDGNVAPETFTRACA